MIIWRRLREDELVEIGDAWCFRYDPNRIDEIDRQVDSYPDGAMDLASKGSIYVGNPASNFQMEGEEVHYWRAVHIAKPMHGKLNSLITPYDTNS